MLVPNATSYVVAPDDDQLNVGVVLTPVAPLAGEGDDGVPGAEPPLVVDTVTESNVDVLSVDVSWLVTMRPTSIVDGNETVVEPTGVHVAPSV